MSRFNYRAALEDRILELNRELGLPLARQELGHIDYRRDGIKSYSLFRIANLKGGTQSLRAACSHAELLDYVEGYLDGARKAKHLTKNGDPVSAS